MEMTWTIALGTQLVSVLLTIGALLGCASP